MIGARLTHRAVVERNVATGEDAWGGSTAPDFQPLHSALACFAWSNQSRELADGMKTAMIEDLRLLVSLDADLKEGDEITSITKRNGDVVITGRLKVEGPVQFKHNHLEAALQRIG